jgi:hypothetical protein
MVLLCNDGARADALLAGLAATGVQATADLSRRLARMHAKPRQTPADNARYEAACNAIASLGLD